MILTGNTTPQQPNQPIYLQRQSRFSNNCGLHALNNIIGHQQFNTQDLDIIIKMHKDDIYKPKHFLGGDYDVSVLVLALKSIGIQTNWLDNRKKEEICRQSRIVAEGLYGYLINKECKGNKGIKNLLGFSGKHWFCVKNVRGNFWLLDSKRDKCQLIPSIETFLAIEMEQGSHVMQIRKETNEE